MYLPLDAFLDIETDFPEQKSSISIRKKRDLQNLSKEKKHTTKVISKREYW
jgi:hypothetical protein